MTQDTITTHQRLQAARREIFIANFNRAEEEAFIARFGKLYKWVDDIPKHLRHEVKQWINSRPSTAEAYAFSLAMHHHKL